MCRNEAIFSPFLRAWVENRPSPFGGGLVVCLRRINQQKVPVLRHDCRVSVEPFFQLTTTLRSGAARATGHLPLAAMRISFGGNIPAAGSMRAKKIWPLVSHAMNKPIFGPDKNVPAIGQAFSRQE